MLSIIHQNTTIMQKSLNTLLGCFLVATLFFTACEREVLSPEASVQPLTHQQLTQAENMHAILLAAEERLGYELGYTLTDVEKLLARYGSEVALKSNNCCYDQDDLDALVACFGATTPLGNCADSDLNGDGNVNAADLIILLGSWCAPVEALMTAGSNIDLFVGSTEGRIYNVTTINGTLWSDLGDDSIFDEVRWYFDGVYVSDNAYALQLETPGWPDFHVGIDCTHGYHEVKLGVSVNCQVYFTEQCVFIRTNSGVPYCTEDFCNP